MTMPHLSFQTVLETERQMLDAAGKQLAIFDKEVEQAQDQVGEQVYASLVTAYNAANAAYDDLVNVVNMAVQASQAGQIAVQLLPPHLANLAQSMQQQPPQNAPAVNQIILSLRFCSLRPSDVWRGEIRIQAGALLERMFNALATGSANAQTIQQMAEVYTSAFCWFETAWFDEKGVAIAGGSANGSSLWSHLFSLKGAALIGITAIAGYFGGKFAVEKYQEWFGGEGGEEIDEEEEDIAEGDEGEVVTGEEFIFDVPAPEQAGGVA